MPAPPGAVRMSIPLPDVVICTTPHLFVRQAGRRSQRRLDVSLLADGDLPVQHVPGGLEGCCSTLSSSNVVQRSPAGNDDRISAGRIADDRPSVCAIPVERGDRHAIDQVLGELLELADRGTVGQGVAPGAEDVVAVEARLVCRQPVGPQQLVFDLGLPGGIERCDGCVR